MTAALRLPLRSRATGIGVAAGVHAAVIGLLLCDGMRVPAPPTDPPRFFLLVPIHTAKPAAPPEVPSARQRRAIPRLAPMPLRAPVRVPSETSSPESPSALPPGAIAVAPPEMPAVTDPFAMPAPAPAPLAERARNSVAKIARELVHEPLPAGLAARRNRNFDRAWQGSAPGFTVDRYLSPDGTSVSRRTAAGKAKCYMPEPFQPRAIARSSSAEREVNCPPDDAGWERR